MQAEAGQSHQLLGIVRLTVLESEVCFRLARDGVDNVGLSERDVQIRQIVPVEESGVQRGNHDVVHVNEIVLEHQAMMGFFADGHRSRLLRGSLVLKRRSGRSLCAKRE